MDKQLQRIIDEADIRTVLLDSARALDERDLTAYSECFTEDGVLEILGQANRGRAAVAAGPALFLNHFARTQHYVSNVTMTIDGDEATALAYGFTMHMPDIGKLDEHIDAGNIWHCRFCRTDAGWKIAHLTLEIAWRAGISAPGPQPQAVSDGAVPAS